MSGDQEFGKRCLLNCPENTLDVKTIFGLSAFETITMNNATRTWFIVYFIRIMRIMGNI